MDIKEKLAEFYNRLIKDLQQGAFKAYRSKQYVITGSKNEWQRISFNMNKMFDFTYNINCQFAVRNSLIRDIHEKIIKRDGLKGTHWPCLQYRPYKMCECFFQNIKDWESTRDINTNISGKVVDFSNQKSIDKWFSGFLRFMEDEGYEFFSRFKEIEGYNKWLNEPLIKNQNLTKTYIEWDSYPGLIASKLCQSPQSEEIFTIWSNYFLKEKYTESVQELNELKEYLDNNIKV